MPFVPFQSGIHAIPIKIDQMNVRIKQTILKTIDFLSVVNLIKIYAKEYVIMATNTVIKTLESPFRYHCPVMSATRRLTAPVKITGIIKAMKAASKTRIIDLNTSIFV